ncbi:MAG TPA: hypothetical protein PL005_14745, partial [Candidatus Hydrogenedentes bacterium]|nr:hypothetical protein [Candidatus Hydrogenedentota bacterium]
VSLTMGNVDAVDNDFDLHVNGFAAYAALAPPKNGTDPCPTASGILTDKGLRPVNLDVVAPGFELSHPTVTRGADGCCPVVLGVSAESVCELIGRMAVHVADEAGKANLNNAGLHTYGHQAVLETGASSEERATRVVRGMSQALTPAEYETRILPGMGIQHSAEAWNMRMGAGTKVGADDRNLWDFESLIQPGGSLVAPQAYDYDVTLPGYGRADDNGNSFLLAFSRRDENASGLPDSGLYLPRLSAHTRAQLSGTPTGTLLQTDDLNLSSANRYYRTLGLLEGMDDPSEFQHRAPLRNRIAETDGDDNDANGTADDLGELGDRTLAVHYELQKMADAGPSPAFQPNEWADINRFITANSESRNVFYVSTPYGDRPVNKLDPNFANAPQLAASLLLNGRFDNAAAQASSPALTAPAALFLRGLRQSNRTLRGALLGGASPSASGGVPGLFPADAQLQALQTAVNIADHRDRDAVRSLLVLEKRGTASLQYEPAEPLNERERVRQQDLFPAGAVQEYLSDAFGIEPARVPQVPADVYGVQSGPVDENITAVDPWWTAITNASGQVQNRLLSYAAAGAEAIRITEIMPRPVRRVEAEILPLNDQINVPPKDQIHYQVDPSIKTPAGTATWTVANMPYFNLNPAPYTEMPLFDMDRVAAMAAPEWKLRTYYQEVDGTGAIVSEQPVLGAQTGYRYTVPAGTVWSPVENDPANVNPDVLEFHFRATDGLPAGRYYLTLNVTDPVTGAMTVDNINQLEYAIRYTTAASGAEGVASNIARIVNIPDAYDVDGDGLDDDLTIERAQLLADYCAKYFQTVDEPEFLAAGAGAPPGWVFLPSRALEDPAPLNPSDYAAIEQYFVILNGSDPTVPTLATLLTDQHTGAFLDTVVAGDTPNTRTLTVIIPPAGTAYDTLCVAVRLKPIEANLVFRDPATGLPILDPVSGAPIPRHLSVNFFDFSQEPDHEYVEVANTTDQELDLSGWTLEVGIPDPAGLDTNPEMRDPFKSVWRVPANTRIAAKGRLLLTFTDQQGAAKAPPLDAYTAAPAAADFAAPGANGIGLARYDIEGIPAGMTATNNPIAYVTVPPIGDTSPNINYGVLSDSSTQVP